MAYIDEKFVSWPSRREITFAGVIRRFWKHINDYNENVGISRGWNEETQKTYIEYYNDRILPLLPNGKAMSSYTRDEFETAIKMLKEKYTSEVSTNDHYEHLIKVVCRVAQEQLDISNCWEDTGDNDLKETQKAKWLIKRKLSEEEEFAICKLLTKRPEDAQGEDIGVLLMNFCSCRNGEAAALDWRDFENLIEHPEVYSIVIKKKTRRNSSDTEARLKTPNGYRKVPAVEFLRDFLLSYKAYVESLIESGELVLPEGKTIDDLPIAHKGKNILKRCSAGDLSKAGKKIFEKIGYRSSKIAAIHNAEVILYRDSANGESIEKDPTTYIFRRNFCSTTKILRLTEAEIHFCMGHSMKNDRETRDMFFCDDLQYEMYLKLNNHPINKKREELLENFFTEKREQKS